jgi:hypothetical protein
MPEQHPIPQQISSYSFKLVGDMTLKQFSQLAGGVIISLILYASPLNPLIKWPLILISFVIGVALAFLPIQDRPLSTWIVVFFRSIYAPTYFVWRRVKTPKEYFAPEEGLEKVPAIAAAEQKQVVAEHTEPVIKTTPSVKKLEEKEKTFLSRVSQNFIAPGTTVVITATPVHTYTPTPVATSISKIPKTINIPETPKIHPEHIISTKHTAQSTQEIPAPEVTTVKVAPIPTAGFSATKVAQFSQEVTPPLPPNRPNIVVGQVLDSNGKIIEGAILEIKDSEGRPVRALRSNKLGHFMIATPLVNGRYEITVEKEGFSFVPFYFDAKNTIIQPIAVWAKENSNLKT